MEIREMSLDDYEEVHALWEKIKGFAMRSIDDSREGVERFLTRNPGCSCVAVDNGKIIGSILCGHDGRQGSMYHVCVDRKYRRHGVGRSMVVHCMNALKNEGISKIVLIAFTSNESGNAFWNNIGWRKRSDCNYYDFVLNDKNIVRFNEGQEEDSQ